MYHLKNVCTLTAHEHVIERIDECADQSEAVAILFDNKTVFTILFKNKIVFRQLYKKCYLNSNVR